MTSGSVCDVFEEAVVICDVMRCVPHVWEGFDDMPSKGALNMSIDATMVCDVAMWVSHV